MTDKIALYLGIVIVALIGFDYLVFDGAELLFLAKKFAEFSEWIAFWR
ncbi:hypothetical protein O2N63_07520 [Aliiroseovarius sp. KMU-50]|uniref:Glyceraldehyde-3-phosphate dehydrogenase n=1 Tax=Aliiroseovarius salicola TaxID=3009082 RepID=A0ABT4W0I9_9RHOB|nr:hypothetical protein [Aliiroseovarius sp. KMU-50]MDA5093934.1 hypothetical protein [Aliiroseovarius sp. KMU-50]